MLCQQSSTIAQQSSFNKHVLVGRMIHWMHCCKTIIILVITIETYKPPWVRFIKWRITWILQLWTICLKGEITRTILGIFKSLRQKWKRTVKMGVETLNYRSPQLWSILPENLRQINLFVQFIESVKKWVCVDCLCKLCELYLPKIGFL